GLEASEESNHFKVTGAFTMTNGGRAPPPPPPARQVYPQGQNPPAAPAHRPPLIKDVYLVSRGLPRHGTHGTAELQITVMVSWLWIGGLVLTLGGALAILPDRRSPA